jgi:N-acetylglucosamine malate deacetylase 2
MEYPFTKETYANEKAKASEKTVLVFCAHSDDQVFGAGGTIAKLHDEGYTIITIILSQGEMSHPWLEKEALGKTRKTESFEAAKILGIHQSIFYGLPEERIYEYYENSPKFQESIGELFEKHTPKIVFTHGPEDTHPSHRQVFRLVSESIMQLRETFSYDPDVYLYDVWTLVNYKRVLRSYVYFDVSETFNRKIEALKLFRSQKVALITLWASVYLRAYSAGMSSRYRLAERFSRIDV